MSNRPMMELRSSGIRVSVWENEVTGRDGTPRTLYSVKPERSYRDREGNWQNTTSFRNRDLLTLAALLRMAYEKLNVSERTPDQEATDGGEESEQDGFIL